MRWTDDDLPLQSVLQGGSGFAKNVPQGCGPFGKRNTRLAELKTGGLVARLIFNTCFGTSGGTLDASASQWAFRIHLTAKLHWSMALLRAKPPRIVTLRLALKIRRLGRQKRTDQTRPSVPLAWMAVMAALPRCVSGLGLHMPRHCRGCLDRRRAWEATAAVDPQIPSQMRVLCRAPHVRSV